MKASARPVGTRYPDPGEAEERFVLDAWVKDVINQRAFRAELSNGHRFVAFRAGRPSSEPSSEPVPGLRIRVEFSPCDMSKARIVEMAEGEGGS